MSLRRTLRSFLRWVLFSRTSKIRIFFTMCTVTLLYFYLNISTKAYSMKWRRGEITCVQTREFHYELSNQTYRVHNMLKEHNLTHFLLYGSLLGVLRYKGFSEWDNDVDLGVLGEQFNPSVVTSLIADAKARGFYVMDKLSRSGELRFAKYDFAKVKEDVNIIVDVFLFYDHSGMRKRAGIETWLLFPHYNAHESYPNRFLMPLKEINFEGIEDMNIPNQGEEIVKYLYRFDWWKVVKPPGCE